MSINTASVSTQILQKYSNLYTSIEILLNIKLNTVKFPSNQTYTNLISEKFQAKSEMYVYVFKYILYACENTKNTDKKNKERENGTVRGINVNRRNIGRNEHQK